MTTLVIDNIGELVTNDPSLGDGSLGVVAGASVVVDGDTVVAVGPAGAAADERLDAGGRCMLPGFVDSHTHLVFAGDRAEEFSRRMAGEPLRRGRHPGHDRRHPDSRTGRTQVRSRRSTGRGAPGRQHHRGDQDGLRAVGGLRGRAGLAGRRDHPRGHLSGRPPGARRVPGARRRLRRAGVWADARRGPRSCPLDRRVLRDRRLRRRPVPGRAHRRPGCRAGTAAPRQPARPRPRSTARGGDGLRVRGPLHLPLGRRHRGSGIQRHRGHVPAGHRLLGPASPTPTPGGL